MHSWRVAVNGNCSYWTTNIEHNLRVDKTYLATDYNVNEWNRVVDFGSSERCSRFRLRNKQNSLFSSFSWPVLAVLCGCWFTFYLNCFCWWTSVQTHRYFITRFTQQCPRLLFSPCLIFNLFIILGETKEIILNLSFTFDIVTFAIPTYLQNEYRWKQKCPYATSGPQLCCAAFTHRYLTNKWICFISLSIHFFCVS